MSTAAIVTATPAAAPATTAPATTAPATTAPATTAPATTAPATTETVNPGAWMAGFNDDLKGYVSNKGFKDPASVTEAYRNLEKLQGVPQERLMKLPEQFYDDKGVLTADGRAIYERLGAPKTPKDYGLEAPKEGGDSKRLESFLAAAHEMGLTKAQAAKLVNVDSAYLQGLKTAAKESADAAFRDQQAALAKDWGAAAESNTRIAQDAVRKLGWDNKKIDAVASALGHAETMKLLCNLGKATGEAAFTTGQRANTPMEPAGAKSRIKELTADKDFSNRLMNGDAEAKATWTRLHQEAFQGAVNL